MTAITALPSISAWPQQNDCIAYSDRAHPSIFSIICETSGGRWRLWIAQSPSDRHGLRSVLERIELALARHRHGEGPQRVQHADRPGVLRHHLRPATIGH